MKKLALVLVLVFALAIPALANPFVDVPLNHWAYDAVQTLAAKGVIVGYPDGTFGGQRTMTRYEFAEALAKALAYAEQNETLAEDVEILSKLAVEFADELATLGVTVADLEATVGEHSEAVAAMQELVDKHEKFFEPITISGSVEVNYEKVVLPTVEPGVLSDTIDVTLEVEVNDTTTASVTLEADDVIVGGGANFVVDDWWLKHFGEELSLWAGEIEPATIGQGLIYDFDVNEEFYGVWAQWMWDTDEDLGTWTLFFDAADFYLLNVAFDLGDDDDIPTSITASYDQAAGGFAAGVAMSFDVSDEDDIKFGLEAGVFSDLATTSFGVAGSLSGVLGDEEDIEAALNAWYTQPGFVPTNSDFDPDELGIELEATFVVVEEDEDDDDDVLGEVIATPYVGYTMDSALTAATDTYVGLELEFPKLDSDNPDCGGCISAEYSILDGSLDLEGELLNVVLSEYDDGSDELLLNVHGEFIMDVANSYDAVANLIYNFDDDPIQLIAEARLDSDGAALYSAEAQLVYQAAENTELKVGVEMNDWEDDINDWDENNILDNKTKIYGGVEISF
ncbi:S-layer homology domain-containing protein [Candidatus Dojkabacteria bacterium]|nr:S-layer homology domain-containing protein [Candidatus Dojkabacteria bacterium]